ncbi:MAG: hypothetical protein RIF41_09660 [Polyangiaceae bacterium]
MNSWRDAQYLFDLRWDYLFDGPLADGVALLGSGPRRSGWGVSERKGDPTQGSVVLASGDRAHALFWNAWCIGPWTQVSGGLYIQDFIDESDTILSPAIFRAHARLLGWFDDPNVLALSLTNEDTDHVDLAPGLIASYRQRLWANLERYGATTDGLDTQHTTGWVTVCPVGLASGTDVPSVAAAEGVGKIFGALQALLRQQDASRDAGHRGD